MQGDFAYELRLLSRLFMYYRWNININAALDIASRGKEVAEAGWGCCQLGWVDNGQTSSNATARGDAASSWPLAWPAFTGRN
jgi:hypothetical protein